MQLARSEHDPSCRPQRNLAWRWRCWSACRWRRCVLDQVGRIRFANAQVVHLFRYAQAEFIDQPVEFFFPAALRVHGARRSANGSAAPRGRAASSLPVQGVRKDGMRLGLHLRAASLRRARSP